MYNLFLYKDKINIAICIYKQTNRAGIFLQEEETGLN